MSGQFCNKKNILFQTENSALEQAEDDYDKEKQRTRISWENSILFWQAVIKINLHKWNIS